MTGASEPPGRSPGANDPELQPAGGNPDPRVLILGARQALPIQGDREARIAQIARLQRGRVARHQLLAAGIASSSIAWLINHGRLIPKHRGVYAPAGQLGVPLADETAALLAMRPGALLSHATAGRLWGLIRAAPPHWIDATVTGGPSASPRGVHIHRAARLDPSDIRQRHSLPVTSPAHTILDLASDAAEAELENLIAIALDAHVLRDRDLQDTLHRHPNHPGASQLRRALQRPAQLTRSHAERLFLDLIRKAQLPMPVVNHRRGAYEPDFIWPEHHLIVEIDGFEHHGGRHPFEADRKRDQIHLAQGMRTMRITLRQLEQEPWAVLARVAIALAHGSS